MRQERFSPSTDVSGWKGRQDYLKGYPGAAMSDALNGGFAGGASYEYEDSYKFFSRGTVNGYYDIQNIPQTHKHLHIEFTISQQSSYWPGMHYLLVNTAGGVSNQPYDGNWSGSRGTYWGKGWSTGSTWSQADGPNVFLKASGGYSSFGNKQSLQIFNYSDTTGTQQKTAKLFSAYGMGATSSYANWIVSFGYYQKTFYTPGGSPSPAINRMSSFDGGYNNGSASHQSFNVYGFGGLV